MELEDTSAQSKFPISGFEKGVPKDDLIPMWDALSEIDIFRNIPELRKFFKEDPKLKRFAAEVPEYKDPATEVTIIVDRFSSRFIEEKNGSKSNVLILLLQALKTKYEGQPDNSAKVKALFAKVP